MKCICCGSMGNLVDSHVVSNFIRLALTGIDTGKAKKFSFKYLGNPKMPSQNLPKPKLMCGQCDNLFGAKIERPAATTLIPKGDLSLPEVWENMRMRAENLEPVLGYPFWVKKHEDGTVNTDYVVRKFSVLTAWRVLHDMTLAGHPEPREFMASPLGLRLQTDAVDFLKNGDDTNDLLFPYYSECYFLGPSSATVMSGADDEMPFCWTFLNGSDQRGVAVLMGYWMIVWNLRADDDPLSNFHELLRETFNTWGIDLVQALRGLHPKR
jgi:hypothetical protein